MNKIKVDLNHLLLRIQQASGLANHRVTGFIFPDRHIRKGRL